MNEKENKRSVRMSLNLTSEEREEFKVGAEIAGMNPNDYCLELHRKGAVVVKDNYLDKEGLRSLTTFTNNFNQLTKKVNQLSEGQLSNAKTVALIRDYLGKILESVKRIQANLTEEKKCGKQELLGLINCLEIQLKKSEKSNADLRKALSNALRRLEV